MPLLYRELLAYIEAMMSQSAGSIEWASPLKQRMYVLGYLYRGSEFAMGVQDMERLWALGNLTLTLTLLSLTLLQLI